MRKQNVTIFTIAFLLLLVNIANAGINEGLIAWYGLNGNATDLSGNSRNGTTYNTTSTIDRFGNVNSALLFNGSNSWVGLPNNTPIWLSQNDFTVSAWVRFDRAPLSSSHDFVLNCAFTYWGTQSACTGYNLFRNWGDGKARFQLETATTNANLNSSYALGQNEWYHLVGVRNGDVQQMYIDGLLNVSQAIPTESIQFNQLYSISVEIGRLSNGGYGSYSLCGAVDDVRIYNRALSSAEVQQLYNVPEPATISLIAFGAFLLRRKIK
jgi:hypothetical protein